MVEKQDIKINKEVKVTDADEMKKNKKQRRRKRRKKEMQGEREK